MGPPALEQCPSNHDAWTLALSVGLCIGLIFSYLPQYIRIISAGTSEGLSPWFLLLGSTSSASAMLNLLIMQWPLFQCCRIVPGSQCFESLLRFIQVWLQWLLFAIVFVLYLVYFPRTPHMVPLAVQGYGSTPSDPQTAVGDDCPSPTSAWVYRTQLLEYKREWRKAQLVTWLVLLHLLVLGTVTLSLLTRLPTTRPPQPQLKSLAQFCGITGTLLAVCQYAPQIYRTYTSKLVGALSLGTMTIQVPGSILFTLSIVISSDTDWTSWLPYAVTGTMQSGLFAICIMWRRRQAKLGIDDFGQPVKDAPAHANSNGEVDETTALLRH